MSFDLFIKALVNRWTRGPKPHERYPVEVASGKPLPEWNLAMPLKYDRLP